MNGFLPFKWPRPASQYEMEALLRNLGGLGSASAGDSETSASQGRLEAHATEELPRTRTGGALDAVGVMKTSVRHQGIREVWVLEGKGPCFPPFLPPLAPADAYRVARLHLCNRGRSDGPIDVSVVAADKPRLLPGPGACYGLCLSLETVHSFLQSKLCANGRTRAILYPWLQRHGSFPRAGQHEV